jgi:hypothetical protein
MRTTRYLSRTVYLTDVVFLVNGVLKIIIHKLQLLFPELGNLSVMHRKKQCGSEEPEWLAEKCNLTPYRRIPVQRYALPQISRPHG